MTMKRMTLKKGKSLCVGRKTYRHGDEIPAINIPLTPKKRSTFQAEDKEFKHGDRVPPALLPDDLKNFVMLENDSFEELKEGAEETPIVTAAVDVQNGSIVMTTSEDE